MGSLPRILACWTQKKKISSMVDAPCTEMCCPSSLVLAISGSIQLSKLNLQEKCVLKILLTVYVSSLLTVGTIDVGKARLMFWDLGGQEELQSLWDKVSRSTILKSPCGVYCQL